MSYKHHPDSNIVLNTLSVWIVGYLASRMLLPPMPDPPGGTARAAALPFSLPELDLGSISKRTAKRKAVVAVEDDEDPLEEAQVGFASSASLCAQRHTYTHVINV